MRSLVAKVISDTRMNEEHFVDYPAVPITPVFIEFPETRIRDRLVRSVNKRKYELDGRTVQISQALTAEERFDKKRLGYVKYAINKNTGIRLHWIHMDLEKKSITIFGQLAGKIESSGYLQILYTWRRRRRSTKSHGQMADKKLITSTVSSRDRGMQRRINQGTTSSQIEQEETQKESQNKTSGIHISFKGTESKIIPFSRSMKKSRKKREKTQQQPVKAQCHKKTKKRKQQMTKAPALNLLETKMSAAAEKPHLMTETKDRTTKRRHSLAYKRTKDR